MDDPTVKVLIVDDEAGLADFMQMTLSEEGYTAFMVNDGISAVNFFKSERPDIILIDVALGDSKIDGVEVLRRIKELDPKSVCIMVSRVTDREIVQKAKEHGALHYILKPLKENDLIAVVKEASEFIRNRGTLND